MFQLTAALTDAGSCFPAVILLVLLFFPLFPGDRRLSSGLLALLFAFLLLGIFSITGIPSFNSPFLYYGPLQWIPLADVLRDPVQYCLNVLLFVPLGALLPLLSPAFHRLKAALLFGGGLSLFIELSQLFNFRSTDINDFLANTAGTALGFALCSLLSRSFAKGFGSGLFSGRYSVAGPLLLCGGTFCIVFFAGPVLSGFVWERILV